MAELLGNLVTAAVNNVPSAPTSTPSNAVTMRPWREAVWWCLPLGWLVLWRAGFPPPHVDDLFFTGTAVELARGGGLTNPWLGAWMDTFGTRAYVMHPPLFPYVLAGWIRLFGVSTAALTGFHCLVDCVAQLIAYLTLRRLGVRPLTACAAVLPIGFLLIGLGMRPDGLALVLLLWSHLLLARRGVLRWCGGAFVAAAAVLTQSFYVTMVVPLYLWQLLRQAKGERLRLVAATAAGVGGALLLFLTLLPVPLPEFLHGYLLHARLVTPPLWRSPMSLWQALSFGHEPLRQGPAWLLGVVALIVALRRQQGTGHFLPPALTALAACALLGFAFYPSYAVHYAQYFVITVAVVILGPSRPFLPALASVALCVWLNLGPLHGWFAPIDRVNLAETRRLVEQRAGTRLLVDATAARLVFDFKLPPGTIDWQSRQPLTAGYSGSIADKRPDDTWVVTEWRLERYTPDAGIRAARLRWMGHEFGSVAAEPERLRVIH